MAKGTDLCFVIRTQDLAEFGIAPRKIVATEDFVISEDKPRKRPALSQNLIPGEAPLAVLIKATRYMKLARVNIP